MQHQPTSLFLFLSFVLKSSQFLRNCWPLKKRPPHKTCRWKLSHKASLAGVLFFTTVLSPQLVHAQVLISEVYPAPPTGENEWVEIFNPTDSPVSLSGWKLQDLLTTPSDIFIFTNQSIAAKSFLAVDLTSAKLNNAGDGVTLYTASNQVSDAMTYSSSETGKSWTRTSLSPATFILSTPTKNADSINNPLVPSASPSPTPSPLPSPTPSASPIPTEVPSPTPAPSPSPDPTVSPSPTTTPLPSPTATPTLTPTPVPSPTATPIATAVPTPLPTPTPTSTPSPTPSPTATPTPNPTATPAATTSPTPNPTSSPTPSPSPTPTPTPTFNPLLIKLTEVMACPATGSEWLELYNSDNQPHTIENWKITDQSGNTRILTGSLNPNTHHTFSWSGSLLNNTGDSFTLTNATGTTVAQFSYEDCTTGQSLNIVEESTGLTSYTAAATPNAANSAQPVSETSTSSASSTSTTTAGTSSTASTKTTAKSASPTPTPKTTNPPPKSSSSTTKATTKTTLKKTPLLTSLNRELFQLPVITVTPIASRSALYIGKKSSSPPVAMISGILSGIVTTTSSLWILYGKKFLAVLPQAP